MVNGWPFSSAFRTLSPLMALKVMVGSPGIHRHLMGGAAAVTGGIGHAGVDGDLHPLPAPRRRLPGRQRSSYRWHPAPW
ncbi:hypothetical protein ACLB1Q_13030 [Escherichia coli]